MSCDVGTIVSDINDICSGIATATDAVFNTVVSVVDQAEKLVNKQMPDLLAEGSDLINDLENMPAAIAKELEILYTEIANQVQKVPYYILLGIIAFIVVFIILPFVVIIFFIR